MKFIDFFAGIGGFRRGLELAGHKCVGFCEWDKYATASYTSMHLITDKQREYLNALTLKQRQKEILKDEYRNGEWYSDDIRTVDARSLPKADCWTFGAPCQDFSVAGKRAGLDGDRSSLVQEIFRLLEEQEEKDRPEWIIYENVKGMLSSNRGLDYLSILSEMDRLGYDIEWQNINSKWFVPQNRERIYTIGHLRRYGSKKILPVTGTDGENSVSIIDHRDEYRRNTQTFSPGGITETLDTGQGGGREHHVGIPCFCDMNYKAGLKTTDSARTIQARYNKGVCNRSGEVSGVVIPVLTPVRAEKRQNGRRFKENGDPMFTLTSQDRHGIAINVKEATKQGYDVAHEGDSINLSIPDSKTRRERVGKQLANTLDTSCNQGIFVKVENELTVYAIWYEKYQCYIAIRKLTPKECFRLQGWTDDYFEKAKFVNSDSQLYKQAGNGVTVNVVRAIGDKMTIRRND
ncbi:DNA (cytosine-5-)-methyltransferase [[Ruminococcus] gnavus]|uniref:DNA (cytosine-5-)-methyltransferase n=1 Tax=Mediterraneibacter gnavus TaxID=33038 RepID=A0AAJ1LL59_MEDGN|nr:DNA (cytosine-5-)-methyltransferase [Mediterraneibacter gnavus]MCZ0690956.1 DNA (cytosine-5-)-methyltransferase [Mediterraneibacter gnavus]